MKRTSLALFGICLAMVFSIAVAQAGNLKVGVSDSGAPLAGAKVTVEPGGHTATTPANGKVMFNGLAAGTYRLAARKVVGGVLRAAAVEEVAVPGAGTVSETLTMSDGMDIPKFFPMTVGSTWLYGETDPSGTSTSAHELVGTISMGGKWVRQEKRVHSSSPTPTIEYMLADAEGYWRYGEKRVGDTTKYDPVSHVPNYLPMGHSYAQEFVLKHSNGDPDEDCSWRMRSLSWDTVTVPAGTFTGCAKLEVRETRGTEVRDEEVWIAPGVGIVQSIQTDAITGDVSKRVLQEYEIARGRRPLPLRRELLPGPGRPRFDP